MVFTMILLSIHSFYAQGQKDLERLQNLEPLRSFYDSILSQGTFLSISMLNRENPNDVFIGAPVNREFSSSPGDTALVNSLNRSGVGYDRFLRLMAMMKKAGVFSLGAVGSPGGTDYEIQIVYAYSGATGKQQAYRYVYGKQATEKALANINYTKVEPGIFKYSFKEH